MTSQKILTALSLGGNLSARQLTRLIFPTSWQEERTYQTVSKNLQRLKVSGLALDKSYGLGREKLWRIKKSAVARKLDLKSPDEVHAHLYEHDKLLGDLFVGFALTGKLTAWGLEGDQKKGLRYDRKAQIFGHTIYLEAETGSQGLQKLSEKFQRYRNHWQLSREDFSVIVSCQTEEHLTEVLSVMLMLGVSSHYSAALHSQLAHNPLEAQLKTTRGMETLVQRYVQTLST